GMGSTGEAQRPGRVQSLVWRDGALHLIDQRRLPLAFETVVCRTAPEVAEAIRTMVVRGAPAIGAAAAYGMVLGARELAGRGAEGVEPHQGRPPDGRQLVVGRGPHAVRPGAWAAGFRGGACR